MTKKRALRLLGGLFVAVMVASSCVNLDGGNIAAEDPSIATPSTVDLSQQLENPAAITNDETSSDRVEDADAIQAGLGKSAALGGQAEPEPAGDDDSTTSPETSTAAEAATESQDPAPAPAPVASNNASAIERRIADLTNQLRSDPNGPLRRQGGSANCDFGEPQAVPALTFNDQVSVQMARTWSAQMSPNNFKHRSNQLDFLQGIGINARAAGENIAYHAPAKSDPAMYHFTQWRESAGHFCNMMNPAFTSIGVGEDQHGGGSYATQNFYA